MRRLKTLRRARYTVRGTGPFPDDMLRYDISFPVTSLDEAKIRRANEEGGASGRLSVELECYLDPDHRRDLVPTAARWNSFCWEVTLVSPIEKVAFDHVPSDRLPERYREG